MHYPSSIVRHSSLGYIKTDPLLLVTVHGHENGSLVIDESNLSISVISADGTIILPSMRIERATYKDNQIILHQPTGDITLVFKDMIGCAIAWMAIDIIIRNIAEEILSIPTMEQIPWLRIYLSGVHPIMYPLIAKSVIRPGYLEALYDLFILAESNNHMEVLPIFRGIILSLFELKSIDVISRLLLPEHIDYTISCLEYDKLTNEHQVQHRMFLSRTMLHRVLDNLHDHINITVQTNYRIAYLKKYILGIIVSPTVLSIIEDIHSQNEYTIVKTLLGDKSFTKQLIRAIVPIMIAVNGNLVHSAIPNQEALGFLKELVHLSVPEPAMRRLVRKLYSAHLFELLEHIFITVPSNHVIILDIWRGLYNKSRDLILQYLFSQYGKLIPNIISHLTNTHEVSTNTYSMIEFLKTIIPTYHALSTKEEESVSNMIGIHISHLIANLFINYKNEYEHSIMKQRLVSDFLCWFVQKRPDLCQQQYNGYLNLFITHVQHTIVDNDITGQKKLLYLNTSRLMNNVIKVSDNVLAYTALNYPNFIDSMLLTMIKNGTKNNILSSTILSMTCSIVEKWISSLFIRDNVYIQRMTPEDKINIMNQLLFAVSSAFTNLSIKWKSPCILNHHVPLLVNDSINNIDTTPVAKSDHTLHRQLAVQRMTAIASIVIRRQQTTALSRWRHAIQKTSNDNNSFLMDAVYTLAWQKSQERCRTMAFVLRKSVLPIVKRSHIKVMFQQWKNMMIYERTKAAKLKEYIEQWKVTQSECTTPSVDSRSSISESPRKQNDTPHHIPKKPTLDSIGEPIGLHHKQKKSDSDVFFFIHAIKNDKEYLSSNTYTPIKKK